MSAVDTGNIQLNKNNGKFKIISMKTIKIIIAVIFLMQTSTVFSQDTKKYEINVKNPKNSKLKLLNLAGDVVISTNNSSKIFIEAFGIKPNPERAKGLKRIGSGGEDNTGVGLNYKNEGNTFVLFGAVSMSSNTKYKITVPKNLKIYVELGMFNNGDLTINDLISDLELDVKTSDIKLKGVSGPTVISSLSGDIDVIFAKVNQSSPFSIKAISGDIDLSLPANTPANLELSSISGGIYTDFDFKTEDNKAGELKHVGGGSKVRTKINGGGVKFYVRAISGNIYFRKKK